MPENAGLPTTRFIRTTAIPAPASNGPVFRKCWPIQKVENPPEKQVTFEGTHKAIIDRETWGIVQKAREQRRPTKMGEMGMFSGLTYCADCGARLYHCRTTSWPREQECYTCASCRTKKQCRAHYIRAVVLEQLVLQTLQRVVAYAQEDEDDFVRRVIESKMAIHEVEREQAKRTLEKQDRRIKELDVIIQRLYEDHVLGKLSEKRFTKMPADYEREQAALIQSVGELQPIVGAAEEQAIIIQSFLKIVRKYTTPSELTLELLHEFVEKIVVHAPDKSSGHRVQRIDIHYNFIGEIDLSPEYSKYSKRTTA